MKLRIKLIKYDTGIGVEGSPGAALLTSSECSRLFTVCRISEGLGQGADEGLFFRTRAGEKGNNYRGEWNQYLSARRSWRLIFLVLI